MYKLTDTFVLILSHATGTLPSVTLPGFLKTRLPTKHSGIMSIWLSAISVTKAGSVAQAVPTTGGLTSYAGTTTARHQLTCGEDPPHVVIREWRYGPRWLRVDDNDELKSKYEHLNSSFHVSVTVPVASMRHVIECLMSAESWPNGLLVKRYFQPKNVESGWLSVVHI